MSVVDNIRNDPMNVNEVDNGETKNLIINDEASQKPLVAEKEAYTDK